MAERTDPTGAWITPWWFIVLVSVVLGVCVGVGLALVAGPDSESAPRWLSFLIGVLVVGGGTAIQLFGRRRKRERNNL
ncbi:hypothetical protein DKL51_19065 [Micromonospora globispora]|nr:hypothetical protein DKL51_19065 [Micromonospora globispora]